MVNPTRIINLQIDAAEKARIQLAYFIKVNYAFIEAWATLHNAITSSSSNAELRKEKTKSLQELKDFFEEILTPPLNKIFPKKSKEIFENIYTIIQDHSSSITKLKKNQLFYNQFYN
jgi:hypothetical protein